MWLRHSLDKEREREGEIAKPTEVTDDMKNTEFISNMQCYQ